jgi:hypothetical protein
MTTTNKELRDRALAVLINTAELSNTPHDVRVTAAQAVLWAVQEMPPFGLAVPAVPPAPVEEVR